MTEHGNVSGTAHHEGERLNGRRLVIQQEIERIAPEDAIVVYVRHAQADAYTWYIIWEPLVVATSWTGSTLNYTENDFGYFAKVLREELSRIEKVVQGWGEPQDMSKS